MSGLGLPPPEQRPIVYHDGQGPQCLSFPSHITAPFLLPLFPRLDSLHFCAFSTFQHFQHFLFSAFYLVYSAQMALTWDIRIIPPILSYHLGLFFSLYLLQYLDLFIIFAISSSIQVLLLILHSGIIPSRTLRTIWMQGSNPAWSPTRQPFYYFLISHGSSSSSK